MSVKVTLSGQCTGCGKDIMWCECPFVAPVRRDYRDTYPPLHCNICGTPYFVDVHSAVRSIGKVNRTCSEACAEELERRYYLGSVLQKPYTRPT